MGKRKNTQLHNFEKLCVNENFRKNFVFCAFSGIFLGGRSAKNSILILEKERFLREKRKFNQKQQNKKLNCTIFSFGKIV